MLRYLTSGESHGQMLVAILDGLPAGLVINIDRVNAELRRRQKGYGRGARQKIETDTLEIAGGVRHGITTGAPLTLIVRNRDWENWRDVMSVEKVEGSQGSVQDQLQKKAIKRFRPGHADLAGTFKYRHCDIRDVLERASARETAARVAVGAVCEQLLGEMGIRLVAHVLQIGTVASSLQLLNSSIDEIERLTFESEMFCADSQISELMKESVRDAWQAGDSLGGIVEVIGDGLPVGLGSYTQWDQKLDGQLAQALMSIQAIKAVEMGNGIQASASLGSEVHDELYSATANGDFPFVRKTNRAGGIEGGMTNGERLVVRAYMKPIPTLRKGLSSLTFPEFQSETAHYERSDVCSVPAVSVVAKSVVAFVMARALIEKFGGDTVFDMKAALEAFRGFCKSPGDYFSKVMKNGIKDYQQSQPADTELD